MSTESFPPLTFIVMQEWLHIIFRAQCKMKMRGPLIKSKHRVFLSMGSVPLPLKLALSS